MDGNGDDDAVVLGSFESELSALLYILTSQLHYRDISWTSVSTRRYSMTAFGNLKQEFRTMRRI